MCNCCGNVSTSEVGLIEYCGKFDRLAQAGCFCLCWPFQVLAGKISLRVQELLVSIETKTKDNVFVNVNVSVQYQAIREKVYSAFYVLADPRQQMQSYVFDTVRASLCTMTLDQSFESKEEISQSLKHHLQEIMAVYGFTIVNALITDLTPNIKVRDAMNEINASKRMKEAAYQRAEGEKIVKVKRAEAEAESMYLSGVGVAKQRTAIMSGLKESITDFSTAINGATPKSIMDLVVLNQYFDTLSEVGRNKNTKVVFLPNDDNEVRTRLLEAKA